MNERIIVEPCRPPENDGGKKKLRPRVNFVAPIRIPLSVRLKKAAKETVFAALTLVLWRIPFVAGFKPFALGYLAAWQLQAPPVARLGLLLIAADAFLSSYPAYVLPLARLLPFVAVLPALSFPVKRGLGSLLSGFLGAALAAAGAGLCFHEDPLGLGLAVAGVLAGILVALALRPGLSVLISGRAVAAARGIEERLSLLVLAVLIFWGLRGLAWGPLTAQGFFGTLMLLLVADYYRLAHASVVGLAFSLSQTLTGGAGLSPVFYGGLGLLAGAGREFGRAGLILGTAAGLALYTVRKSLLSPADIRLLAPHWTAALIYPLIPERLFSFASVWLADPAENDGSQSQEQKLRAILMDRLRGLAEVFDRLSQSFAPAEPNPESAKPSDIYAMIEEISQKNCQQCTGYELCWGENFYSTYREIFDLFALAEMNGQVMPKNLTGRLAKNCFQQFRLLSAVNHRMEQQKSSAFWRRRLDESRNFLSGQLQGVANIMSGLAQEIRLNVDFRCELEAKLKSAFNRWGLTVRELAAVQFGEDRLEIRIEKRNCGGCQECRFVVAPLISRLLGQKIVVWRHDCRHNAQDSICRSILCPARKYGVRTAVCKKPRKGNVTSGDSHALMEMKEGYFVAILSDGMGVGPKAAVESGTTVSILEQLLKAGLNREFAVQMVNSVLLLRNQEETFATLDLALLDLYTAQAEFVKIGAAPTYVKRDGEVTVIRSTSLPVGILNNVDAEISRVSLLPGDFVVLVTDGVLEGREGFDKREDWVWRALKKAEFTGPDALGQYLLDLATGGSGEGAGDDVTVVALQLYEED